MKNKTALKQFRELEDAVRNLFLVLCYELKIDKMVKWLDVFLKKMIRAFKI